MTEPLRVTFDVACSAEHAFATWTARIGYLWHLRRDRGQATEVEIRFVSVAAAATRVEIEHRGWERLGDGAEEWRDRNRGGWQTLTPHFIEATRGAGT